MDQGLMAARPELRDGRTGATYPADAAWRPDGPERVQSPADRALRDHQQWAADARDYAAGLTCPEAQETYRRVGALFEERIEALRQRRDPGRRAEAAAVGGPDRIPGDLPRAHCLLGDPMTRERWSKRGPIWTARRVALVVNVVGMTFIALAMAHALDPSRGILTGEALPDLAMLTGPEKPVSVYPQPEGADRFGALSRGWDNLVGRSRTTPEVRVNAPAALPHVKLPLEGQHIVIE